MKSLAGLGLCAMTFALICPDQRAFGLDRSWTQLPGVLGDARDAAAERNEGPYFFVDSDDPSVDRLPLRSTWAEVHVAGAIAQVKLVQIYSNDGARAIDAVYVFPASTRAAVYGMKMRLGDRVVQAEIASRTEAKQKYDRARDQGQTASLLEQQRPNVFQMNVANIQPGDEVQVELFYTEFLVPVERTYELVIPAVVGPRYASERDSADGAEGGWNDNPYLHQGEVAHHSFGLRGTLSCGLPIARLQSSHDLEVDYQTKHRVELKVHEDPEAGNRDFVLHYQLAGAQIESGLLLYAGAENNYFALTVEPPARVESEAILPREYIFILDVSGSMNGFPLQVSGQLMFDLLDGLRPQDRFNILHFAGASGLLAETSLPATAANIARAKAAVTLQQGGGGTELLPALERALSLPTDEDVSRIIVIATDGYVQVERRAFELVRERRGTANVFAFGIGAAVNRFLIEGLARAGGGEPFVVLNEAQAATQAERFHRYIQAPLLRSIEVTFDGIDAYDVEPVAVGDLFAERPVQVFGKVRGQPRGAITIRGETAQGPFESRVVVTPAAQHEDHAALRYLWARQRVATLADLNRLDQDDQRGQEILQLGLRYSLLTEFTSFVAVDSVRPGRGDTQTVRQPLPMPAGVGDGALGCAAFGRSSGGGFAAGGIGYGGGGYGAGATGYSGLGVQSVTPRTGGTSGPTLFTLGSASNATSGAGQGQVGQRAPSRPSLRSAGLVEVRGALDRGVVERVLRQRKVAVSACLASSRGPVVGATGKVTLRLEISARGVVEKVSILSSTLPADAGFELCLRSVFKKARFPAAKGGGKVVVTWPVIIGG